MDRRARNVALLVSLVALENSVVLVGRYTRSSVRNEDLYNIGHLVFMTEVTKFLIACGLEFHRTNGELYQSMYTNNIEHPWAALRVSVPALLYFIQNCLVYVGLTNLPAPVFHVTQQMKLVVVAMVSVVLLQRRYTPKQWMCLVVISIGVAIVTLRPQVGGTMISLVEESSTMGLIAVSVGSFCSALAGVYFEKILKSKDVSQQVSVWMRNIQLAFFSIVLGLLQQMFSRTSSTDVAKPYFHGFTKWVWALVVLRASSGMLVATIIKYADNVIKGIVTAVSVVVGCVLSWLFFGVQLSSNFIFGAGLVLSSSYLFSNKVRMPSPETIQKTLRSNSLVKGTYVLCVVLAVRALGLDRELFGVNILCVPGAESSCLLDQPPRLKGTHRLDRQQFNMTDIQGQLVFHIFGATKYLETPLSCDGCRSLRNLHSTLEDMGFEASFGRHCPWSLNATNVTVVLVHPETSKINCRMQNAVHVRWMLAPLGVVANRRIVNRWSREDLVFHFATGTGPNVTHLNVLQVSDDPEELEETINVNNNNNNNNNKSNEKEAAKATTTPEGGTNRSGIAFLMGNANRFHKNATQWHLEASTTGTEITVNDPPLSIKNYEYLVSYDPYSYWIWFAALSGTVVVVQPIEGVDKLDWLLSTFHGAYLQHDDSEYLPGIAYGWTQDEIDYARSTMADLQEEMDKVKKWGEQVTVPRFIRDCYRYSLGQRSNFEAGKLVPEYYREYLH